MYGGIALRTNIVLDEELVQEGMKLTNAKTMRELVNRALLELVSRERRKRLLKHEGKVRWDGDLRQMRRGRDLDTD